MQSKYFLGANGDKFDADERDLGYSIGEGPAARILQNNGTGNK